MSARFKTWEDLSAPLQSEAVAKLRRLADLKARYDGTLLPYAWPERIAPLLRYVLAGANAIWDCQVPLSERKRGRTLFTMPIPGVEVLR